MSELKPQVYVDERAPELFDPAHRWARSHRPDYIYDLTRLLFMPYCMLAFRLRCVDSERVPREGPAILAPNHFSAMDHFFCGIFLRRRVRFMAKSQLFKGPLGWFLRHVGAFPVMRGRGDEQAIATAVEILRRGGVVVIYPEGGRSRSGQVGSQAHRGVGRLALESGAPVIPVAIHGSLNARNWKRLQFPRVVVAYAPPLRYPATQTSTRELQKAAADEVLGSVRTLYAQLEEQEARRLRPAGRRWALP